MRITCVMFIPMPRSELRRWKFKFAYTQWLLSSYARNRTSINRRRWKKQWASEKLNGREGDREEYGEGCVRMGWKIVSRSKPRDAQALEQMQLV